MLEEWAECRSTVGCLHLATSTLPDGTLRWATCSRSWSTIFVSTTSCAPRVFRRASQGPQGRVVPLRGVQGKARSPVTYCSQQRPPGRVPPWFYRGVSSSPYTAPTRDGPSPVTRWCKVDFDLFFCFVLFLFCFFEEPTLSEAHVMKTRLQNTDERSLWRLTVKCQVSR